MLKCICTIFRTSSLPYHLSPPAGAIGDMHGSHFFFKANGIRFHAVQRGEGPLMLWCVLALSRVWWALVS